MDFRNGIQPTSGELDMSNPPQGRSISRTVLEKDNLELTTTKEWCSKCGCFHVQLHIKEEQYWCNECGHYHWKSDQHE